jgi:hypothetical protein
MIQISLALALLASPVATAAQSSSPASPPERLKVAFGNTVVSTYPDGRKGKLWLNADGTYTAAGRRNTPSSGKWSIKGDKICLKQQKPMAGPFSYCTDVPTGGIGTEWPSKAVTGEKIRVKVISGIQRTP